jgi:hypothetical protein
MSKKALADILPLNKPLYRVISKMADVGLPNYYIGAGCIAQTVWNYQSGLELTHGISDIDVVYHDASDLSYEAENAAMERIRRAVEPCAIRLDIKNQARVHLWYKEYFGFDIAPYDSVESAINTWPTTATAVGVRLEGGHLKVYAPFGLNDLFGMVVRANKTLITEEIYMQKVRKWREKWPLLTIVPW